MENAFYRQIRAFSLYKTGSGFRYQIFSQLAEKFPIDLEHSQLAEKSKFKRLTFPILLKIALFFPKIVVYFPKITQFFPNIIGTNIFPKRSEKALQIHVHVCDFWLVQIDYLVFMSHSTAEVIWRWYTGSKSLPTVRSIYI